jgi:hypothetical protein
MPTACGFSVSCGQVYIGVLIVLKLGYQIILGRTVFVTFPCSGCATMVVMLACLQILFVSIVISFVHQCGIGFYA